MGKKLGSDYRVWIESGVAAAFNEIKGQGNLTINRGGSAINTTTKDDGNYGTSAPGARTVSIDLDITPNLPDANGYTRVETVSNASPQLPVNFQIRKGGSAGVAADVVFACSMYASLDNTAFGQGDATKVKTTLLAAAPPTVDILA